MKRMLPFLLALLLLLPACGQIAPEPETAIETTTEEESTIEIETATEAPFVPTGGESGEITWRTVDITSDEGREAVQWLAQRHEEIMRGTPDQFPMGKDKTIIAHNKDKIILRDNKTGKETVLLERTYIGDKTTPEEALLHEEAWKAPWFEQVLDDRYFVYCWVGWEWSGDVGVYDTKNMREIPVEWDKKYPPGYSFNSPQIRGDTLYLFDATYGEYDGPLHLMRVDLKALDTLKPGEALMAEDIFAEIGAKDAEMMFYRLLTEDGRYLVTSEYRSGLRVYDLRQKKLVLELPVSISGFDENESYWWPDQIVLRGSKLYWTNDWTGTAVKYLAEITLP